MDKLHPYFRQTAAFGHPSARLAKATPFGNDAPQSRRECLRFPPTLPSDQELVERFSAFFRTLSGQKPSRDDLEKSLEITRSTQQP